MGGGVIGSTTGFGPVRAGSNPAPPASATVRGGRSVRCPRRDPRRRKGHPDEVGPRQGAPPGGGTDPSRLGREQRGGGSSGPDGGGGRASGGVGPRDAAGRRGVGGAGAAERHRPRGGGGAAASGKPGSRRHGAGGLRRHAAVPVPPARVHGRRLRDRRRRD